MRPSYFRNIFHEQVRAARDTLPGARTSPSALRRLLRDGGSAHISLRAGRQNLPGQGTTRRTRGEVYDFRSPRTPSRRVGSQVPPPPRRRVSCLSSRKKIGSNKESQRGGLRETTRRDSSDHLSASVPLSAGIGLSLSLHLEIAPISDLQPPGARSPAGGTRLPIAANPRAVARSGGQGGARSHAQPRSSSKDANSSPGEHGEHAPLPAASTTASSPRDGQTRPSDQATNATDAKSGSRRPGWLGLRSQARLARLDSS